MNQGAVMAAALLATAFGAVAEEAQFNFSGNVGVEFRTYLEEGRYDGQGYHTNLSLSVEPELYWEWASGDSSVTFKPFARWDLRDDERTHGDIRELLWVEVGDDWETRVGIGKVFWGVTEFQHLVDVVNQTDGVESFDGEEKLGQPMLSLSVVRDWGILDGYILPGFRERTFAGSQGRLRPPQVVDGGRALYESGAEDKHVDLALRWSHSIDIFDLGAYWFKGTNRDPVLIEDPKSEGALLPYYEQIDQFGLDAQATIESWLLKFEGIVRDNGDQRYSAIQSGFEYTFYGVYETDADIGVLLEYGWDERGKQSSSSMQNDLTLGGRLTLNDAESSEVLVGLGYDLDYQGKSLVIEGNFRMGTSTKVVLDGQFFDVGSDRDPAWAIRDDGYLQLTIEQYF